MNVNTDIVDGTPVGMFLVRKHMSTVPSFASQLFLIYALHNI